MAVQRFTQGVSTAASTETLASFGMPDPTKWQIFWNDFNDLIDIEETTRWIITTTGAGTEAISDAENGELLITNAAADDDADFLQSVKEVFGFTSGKELYFKARMKVSDVTQSDFIMGLQIRDTTPLAVSDGVWFQKNDGDAALDFHIMKDSVEDSINGIPVTIEDATYFTVGFYYDGASTVEYFFNDVSRGTFGVSHLPTTELTVSFGIQNGTDAAKTMTVDYILVACER